MTASTPHLLLLLSLLLVAHADPTFRFASYYGSHMVLQQQPARALIWGYGVVGAQVTVTLARGTDTITKKATIVSGETGVWKVLLDPVDHGGPYHLLAQQTSKAEVTTVHLEDVLFGDVWLCSGQSNMEMTVSQIFNASEELARASHFPHVRLFTAALVASDTELEDLAKVDLPWSLPTAQNLGHGSFTYFSAVCWLFGRHLAHRLNYPIGLVESSWGGTPVEAWSSKSALKQCGITHSPEPDSFEDFYKVGGPSNNSVLWNAMIHPLLNLTIKGAIWYQGEANCNINPYRYNCTFPTLISDWRENFHAGSLGQTERSFPFGFVQLSTYEKVADNFPLIRWQQTADYGFAPNPKMPNTFMAVAMDLCDEKSPWGSIHPRDKQTVAYRLFLGARAIAYGEKDIQYQGPFPVKVDIFYDYSYLNITYDQKLLILHTSDKIFEVFCSSAWEAGEEESATWVPAAASLMDSSSVVTVHLHGCPRVRGLRYAWSDWPCDYKGCPIYSTRRMLPAPLFVKYFD